jgi:hypothetical protein
VTLVSVEDTFLVDDDGGANGTQSTLDIGQNATAVGLFRFELGAAAAAVKAGRARATLFLRVDHSANFGEPGTAKVFPVRDGWRESEATWRLAASSVQWQVRGGAVGGGAVTSASKGAEIQIPLDDLEVGASWVTKERLSLLVEPSGSLRASVVAREAFDSRFPRLEVRYCP